MVVTTKFDCFFSSLAVKTDQAFRLFKLKVDLRSQHQLLQVFLGIFLKKKTKKLKKKQ